LVCASGLAAAIGESLEAACASVRHAVIPAGHDLNSHYRLTGLLPEIAP
jgi:hypothetical protein